jgi:pilus assembly protein FimV
MYDMYVAYIHYFLAATQSVLLYLNESLTPIGCLALAGFLVLVLFVIKFKNPKQTQPIKVKKTAPRIMTNQHIDSIAGDDVMTTQLDLARAYIEMDEIKLAKEILSNVIQDGNPLQQRQAQHLITGL